MNVWICIGITSCAEPTVAAGESLHRKHPKKKQPNTAAAAAIAAAATASSLNVTDYWGLVSSSSLSAP